MHEGLIVALLGPCRYCSHIYTCACVWCVQDLNLQPQLLEQLDSSYHAVLCVNGIQYLTQPETVLAEVGSCTGLAGDAAEL